MRRLILAALVAVIVLAVPATASASVKSCGTRGFDFGRVTVKVAGATSCPFGWKAYRAFRRKTLRTGRYPQWLRVRSPITHRRYRIARIEQSVSNERARWRYTGVGTNDSTLDVRFRWVAY